ADPKGSILFEYIKSGKLLEAGSWAVEGIGEDFIPEIADMSLVTEAFEIDDAESFATVRELLRKEGIFGGSSTGTLVAGALRYCRKQTKPKRGADVSQLPVVDQDGRALGIIDESDILVKVHRDPLHFNDPVKNAMTSKLETLSPKATIKDLLDVFDRGRVAIVMEDDKFLG